MARFRIMFQGRYVYVEVDHQGGTFTVLAAGQGLAGELVRGESGLKVGKVAPGIDEDAVRQIEAALNRPPRAPSRPFGAPC
jgi:hypothetical protein